MLKRLRKGAVSSLLDTIDTFVFDCDGVIWEFDEALPGAARTIERLLKEKKTVIFITNNSSKSVDEYLHKFTKLCLPTPPRTHVFTSGATAAWYISRLDLPQKSRVHVVGMPALMTEVRARGLSPINADDHNLPPEYDKLKLLKKDPSVAAVLVGGDFYFNHAKASIAASYLMNPSIPFIGTNSDNRLITKDREVCIAGTGSIIKMVEFACERKATYVGKPEKIIFDHLSFEFPIDKKRTMMIGDTLTTDIIFGQRHGLQTLLVETGTNTESDVRKIIEEFGEQHEGVPNYVCESLDVLSAIE